MTNDDKGVNLPTLLSTGIDIGSTTSHFIISRLTFGRASPRPEAKLQVLKREEVYLSPVIFTPFRSDNTIDSEELKNFIRKGYTNFGILPSDIKLGATILTGIAAEKKNAREIADSVSELAGDFVCVTAGPRLEAILSANGSGAVERSRSAHLHELHIEEEPMKIMNVDIGGGTTKFAVVRNGKVLNTAAVNIGARLIAWDENGRITRLEETAKEIANHLGLDVDVGSKINNALCEKLSSSLVDSLFEFILKDGENLSTHTMSLLITDPPKYKDHVDSLVFSGGVSEYIYGRDTVERGDLGLRIGQKISQRIGGDGQFPMKVDPPTEYIRATVVGASQYSAKTTGNTIYFSDEKLLPVKNVPIYAIELDHLHKPLTAEVVAEEFRRAETTREREELVAFAIHTLDIGYSGIKKIIAGMRESIPERLTNQHVPLILIFNRNIGKQAGFQLREEGVAPNLIVLDELELEDMTYIDIGLPLEEDGAVPVIMKSLVF